jgi:predicted ester cyclase
MRIEDVLAEGDHVITRVTGRGTHLGEWMGIEPTGREVRSKGIDIDRLEHGRIVEHRGEADTVGMLVQMGVDPFAGRAAS